MGRYLDVTLKDQICQLCNNAVEEEIHYLCKCTRYMDYRESLCREAKEVDVYLNNLCSLSSDEIP